MTIYLPDHRGASIIYSITTIILVIYFIIYLWKETKPLWKTMAVLTILIVLLPINTHDYRLIFLFVPMLMYLAADEKRRNDLFIVILWGLLLVPKNYYHLEQPAQNIGMIINPLLLTGLLICIVPDAFSIKGVSSTFRFAFRRLRSVVPNRKLENSC